MAEHDEMNVRSSGSGSADEGLCPSSFVPLRRPRRPAPHPPPPPISLSDQSSVQSQADSDRVRSYDSVHTAHTLDTNQDVLDELEALDDEASSGHELFGRRRSCLGHVVQTLCRQVNYFDDERDIHLDFLTATQLQRIVSLEATPKFEKKGSLMQLCTNRIDQIDTHKSRFRQNHQELSLTSIASNSWTSEVSFQSNNGASNQIGASNETSYFGCDVNLIEHKTGGLQLPPFIENLLVYLMRRGAKSVGIFRKSGVKSRIAALREACDQWSERVASKSSDDQSTTEFDALLSNFSVFDAADTLKMWLRELRPTPLITSSMVLAHKDLVTGRCDVQQFHLNVFSLMTDAQRYILLILLHMLNWFAKNCASNHMTAQNLAICFAPSLCEIRRNSLLSHLTGNSSTLTAANLTSGAVKSPSSCNKTKFSNSVPLNSHLSTAMDALALVNSNSADSIYSEEAEALSDAQKCLEHLIDQFDKLLYFNSDLLNCSSESSTSGHLNVYSAHNPSVYLLNGGNLLPQKYESSVAIAAAPVDILHRILYERNLYDATLLRWEVMESRNKSSGEFADQFKIWKQTSVFLPIKKQLLTRQWSFFEPDLPDTLSTSQQTNKSCKNPKLTCQGILVKEEGFLYQSVYKITTNGDGKTNVRYSVAYDLRYERVSNN
jgi:hypothetical protein